MTTRREARERALELLYEAEIKGQSVRAVLEQLPVRPDPFTVELVTGVDAARPALDARIDAHLRADWRPERIATIERLVLRLGAYELEAATTPTPVVLAEAVELVGRFGGAESTRFVNGVLAALAAEAGGDGPTRSR